MSPRKAFLASVIGKPYAPGAEGPHAFDCYGLTRHALANLYGVRLPANRDAPIDRRAWRRVVVAREGAVALMGAARESHIGLYVGGGVLHALEGLGVIFDDVASLRLRGFGVVRFYVAV